MSDSVIHPHNEIMGLVPVNHHQHDDSRKFQKRKKRDKNNDDAPAEILAKTEEAVEDLLHHPEDEDAPEVEKSESSETPQTDDARDHLDLLL